MYNPYVSVLVGLPGSGKSTFRSFIDDPEFADTVFVYSTDDILEDIARATKNTYNGVFKDHIAGATKCADERLKLALDGGYSVYWDQTNMSPKKRKSILSKFPKNYTKECRCVVPPRNSDEWAELSRRLLSREGKTIPHHIVESMADTYVEPELDEGFDYIEIVDIYGNLITTKGKRNV